MMAPGARLVARAVEDWLLSLDQEVFSFGGSILWPLGGMCQLPGHEPKGHDGDVLLLRQQGEEPLLVDLYRGHGIVEDNDVRMEQGYLLQSVHRIGGLFHKASRRQVLPQPIGKFIPKIYGVVDDKYTNCAHSNHLLLLCYGAGMYFMGSQLFCPNIPIYLLREDSLFSCRYKIKIMGSFPSSRGCRNFALCSRKY